MNKEYAHWVCTYDICDPKRLIKIHRLLCMLGVNLGNVFGAKYKSKAELAGGIILVLIGVKILLEHMGVLK